MSLETKQKKFEEEFEERTQEILILTDNSGIGAAGMGDGVWKPSQDFLAYVDMKTGKVYEGKGRIEWLAEEKDKGNWIHSLGMEKIYRLQVKKRKPRELPDYMLSWLNNGFLLIKVVERNVKHPELEKILEEYKRPVFLDVDGCGTFELEKQ